MKARVHPAILTSMLALAVVAPTAAAFNDVVQVVCDEDNPTAGFCSLADDGLKSVFSVVVSPDDKHVYACSALADVAGEEPLQNESLTAFLRAADGSLTVVDQEIEGSGDVMTLDSCRGVAISPDGKHVYTASLLDRAVTWFSRNPADGTLTFTAGDSESGAPGSSLSGANAIAVSPDDEHVYVAGRSGSSVAAFSRDTTSGDLTSIGDYFDGVAGVDGLANAEGIAVSPDGKHVYVASEGDNAVAVFSRETDSGSPNFGELTFVEAQFDGVGGVDGLEGAGSVALDPSGDNVYVGSLRGATAGDWFAVFSRNSTSGALTLLQSFQSSAFALSNIFCGGVGPTTSGVAVSPDGLFVTVSNPFLGAIVTFSRAADGTLTLVESICDDLIVLGTDDIGAPIELAYSPDGKNLYSAGSSVSTLATIDAECDSMEIDLVLMTQDVSTMETETACRSIEVSDYNVLAAGDVTMESPQIEIGNDVSVIGLLKLITGVP